MIIDCGLFNCFVISLSNMLQHCLHLKHWYSSSIVRRDYSKISSWSFLILHMNIVWDICMKICICKKFKYSKLKIFLFQVMKVISAEDFKKAFIEIARIHSCTIKWLLNHADLTHWAKLYFSESNSFQSNLRWDILRTHRSHVIHINYLTISLKDSDESLPLMTN